MPIYTWECPKCGKITEVINSFKDSEVAPEKCDPRSERIPDAPLVDGKPQYAKYESCGTTTGAWKKIIGNFNFILSGRGWARDGYQ